MEARTGKLDYEQLPGLFTEHTDKFIVDDDDVDSCRYYPDDSCTGWMIECARFKTNPQKMQHKTATNILECGECSCSRLHKHLYSWERITQNIHAPSKILVKITLWSRCSRYLRSWYWNNQMRFLECLKSFLENSTWKQSSLVNDEEVISLSHAKVNCSQIVCYVLERWIRTQHQILFGSGSWNGSKIHHNTEHWIQSTEKRWNSIEIFSKDSQHWSVSAKSKSSWAKDELSSCRC